MCNYVLKPDKSDSAVTTPALGTLGNDSNTNLNQSGFLSAIGGGRNRSSTILSPKDLKRLSLQSNQSRSFQKEDLSFGPTPQQKGFKVFYPSVYEYTFEIPIDNNCPETTKLLMAYVV